MNKRHFNIIGLVLIWVFILILAMNTEGEAANLYWLIVSVTGIGGILAWTIWAWNS